LNLTLQNLLIGENFNLKITDFKYSKSENDKFHGNGPKNFRAPEHKSGICENSKAADVYSCGIILFAKVTGCLPYLEEDQGNSGNSLMD